MVLDEELTIEQAGLARAFLRYLQRLLAFQRRDTSISDSCAQHLSEAAVNCGARRDPQVPGQRSVDHFRLDRLGV